MKVISIVLFTVGLLLSTIAQAQVADVIGDVADPCIDIVETDISANSESITASLWLDADFCSKAQYQFHVDVSGDGVSDYGYMAKLNKYGEFSFHGSSELLVEIDGDENGVSFNFPVAELMDEYGVPVDEVSVWFRTHLDGEADLFPDKFEGVIDLTLGIDALRLIGEAGGQIAINDPESDLDGTMILVPPGALSENIVITLQQSGELPKFPIGKSWGGPSVEFGPSGLVFSLPVEIQLRYNDVDNDGFVDGTGLSEANVKVITSDNYSDWTESSILSTDSANNFIVTTADHFSAFTPIVELGPADKYWSMWSGDQIDWVDDSQVGTPPGQWVFGYSRPTPEGDGKALWLWARANEKDRSKVATKTKHGAGITSWRVYVPKMNEFEKASIGAFLRADDDSKELDFEIGSGWVTDRLLVSAAGDSEVLAFMTSQRDSNGIAWKSPETQRWTGAGGISCLAINPTGHCSVYKKLQANRWYDFTISVEKAGAGKSKITWFINGVPKLVQIVNYSEDHRIHASMETLDFIGHFTPTVQNNADFDSVKFTSTDSTPHVTMNINPISYTLSFSLSSPYQDVNYSGTVTNSDGHAYGPHPGPSTVVLQSYITQGAKSCAAAGAVLVPDGWAGDNNQLGYIGANQTITIDSRYHTANAGLCSQSGLSTGGATLRLELRVGGAVTDSRSWGINLVN